MPGTPSSSRSAVTAVLFDSTLAADAASIDTGADGIASGHRVLEVWVLARTSEAVDVSSVAVTLNDDTGAKYDRQTVRGANAAASAAVSLAQTAWTLAAAGDTQQAGAAAVARLTLPAYTQTTFHKTAEGTVALPDDTAANNLADVHALRFRDTAAISRLKVAAGAGNLRAGSRLLILAR